MSEQIEDRPGADSASCFFCHHAFAETEDVATAPCKCPEMFGVEPLLPREMSARDRSVGWLIEECERRGRKFRVYVAPAAEFALQDAEREADDRLLHELLGVLNHFRRNGRADSYSLLRTSLIKHPRLAQVIPAIEESDSPLSPIVKVTFTEASEAWTADVPPKVPEEEDPK